MSTNAEKALRTLFARRYGHQPDQVTPLPPSGSNRQYFRLLKNGIRVIGAFNPDKRENRAFLSLTATFREMGLPVPDILAEDTGECCYLVTDLGDTTLFSLLPRAGEGTPFSDDIIALYKQAIAHLVSFQVDGGKKVDFSIAYPRPAFDKRSIMWDLNYFKYYWLKTSDILFDEDRLEDEFEAFSTRITEQSCQCFMYRDFQSRNVMVVDGKTHFIDYQGGRKGPPAYDIASLLFDAKACVPFDQREMLLDHYIGKLSEKTSVDATSFRQSYYDLVAMRILQAMGTYGFRGRIEQKPLFLESVPFAKKNLAWLDQNGLLPDASPYLSDILRQIAGSQSPVVGPPPDDELTVRICSFSYKKGIPADNSGHGGGFVFDCRALPNPGRLEQYRSFSGKHPGVVRYLERQESVKRFLNATKSIVEQAVQQYLDRGFTSLAVCFGCTGGQHRSVYCAEAVGATLKEKFDINLVVQHFEESNWPRSGTGRIR